MAAIYKGARADKSAPRTSNPVLTISPEQAHRQSAGTRPRPAYAPEPAGPSHNEILDGKLQHVGHAQAIAHMQKHIDSMEVTLSRLDPQRVLACPCHGYTEPPERVARAAADKAAGFETVWTPELAAKIMAGTAPRPTFGEHPPYHAIHDIKRRIVHYRQTIDHAQAHNAYIEADLARTDPNRVHAARVGAFKEPQP